MEGNHSAHVLIVDDNQADLDYLKLVLEQHHISADCINNPINALKIVDPELHNIVLLDINMPQINGYDFILQVKEKADCAGIPIIFISALDKKKHIQKAFSIGAQDYIQKPFIPDEVIARINVRLNQAKQLKKLKRIEKQIIDESYHSPIKTGSIKDLKTDRLSLLNDIFPRLNLLKKKKIPHDQRKKIIAAIEKDLTDNATTFTQKVVEYRLTPTEKRIVLFLISGLSSKEIAELFNNSVQTIKTHRKNIRKKMGITNQETNLLEFFFLDS